MKTGKDKILNQIEADNLKKIWFDLYFNKDADIHYLATMLKDKFNVNCGQFIGRGSLMGNIRNVIHDLETE